jgi:hypothetical protein
VVVHYGQGGVGSVGIETLRTFTTSNGGRTWQFKGRSCREDRQRCDCDQ